MINGKFREMRWLHTVKAYIHFCLDEEDSFGDEINDYVADKLAVFKSLLYVFSFSYKNETATGKT